MAFDKVVDSAQLDSAMTYTAGRIREKTGETASIPWNAAKGFGDAIDAITAGSQNQIKVHTEAGATVTATMGEQIVSGTAGTDGICLLDVPENGDWTVKAVSGGVTSDSQSVTVTDVYDISISFISATLNDNSWATIRAVSDKGEGANYWSVGDCKEVTLNGTVAAMTFSNYTTCAYILGFNHNAAQEGNNRIHFQMAKTAVTDGINVCFCDSYYLDTGGGFRMNLSNSTNGGWSRSNMRTAICGTSVTETSGTMLAVIPSDLLAVIKTVTKYTDNVAGTGIQSAVTATTDYFFLLSEFEVFGTIKYANPYEKTMQSQYAYYSAGNSKIKYENEKTTSAAFWWLRSPPNGYVAFTRVTTVGTVAYGQANYSSGFAPGFCV